MEASFILLLEMERDFPKHWQECEIGKRTPEEKQNFRQKCGGRKWKQRPDEFCSPTFNLRLPPRAVGSLGWQVLQRQDQCAHFHIKGKHTDCGDPQ